MSKPIPERSLEWMPKTVWGPMKWRELHSRALAYLPMKGEKKWLYEFVESIPCPKCQHHFQSFIAQHPPELDDRVSFFRWTVDAHNFVNRALEKPTFTYAEALATHPDQWMAPKEM